jgi:ring-1,2-phenylacetyl-CoA epoxidase subunit PaaD
MNIENIRNILSNVTDPEIPVLSIEDIGILRDIRYNNEILEIVITPTYSGCPAMYQIEDQIKKVLNENDIINFKIITQLSPAWTTDWMTDIARRKLKESGIAPPKRSTVNVKFSNLFDIISLPKDIECPFCNSTNTRLINEFGSTACKSLHFCNNCKQGFDYFKCH